MTGHRGRGAVFVLSLLLLAAAGLLLLRREVPQDPYQNEAAQLDPGRLEEGVVALRYTGEPGRRVKVQITREGGVNYNYDLADDGSWESYSLTDGDGVYTIRVLVQKDNGRYRPVYTLTAEQDLEDDRAPFLASTQFVRYEDTAAAGLAGELTEGAGEGETIAALFDYVTDHLTYDQTQAETVEKGYVPDVDAVLERGEGICVDYATLLCAMVRSRGIPCKLVMGDAAGEYHAWVEVWSGEEALVDGITLAAGGWTRLDPTFLSGEPSEEVREFAADGGNYVGKYVY